VLRQLAWVPQATITTLGSAGSITIDDAPGPTPTCPQDAPASVERNTKLPAAIRPCPSGETATADTAVLFGPVGVHVSTPATALLEPARKGNAKRLAATNRRDRRGRRMLVRFIEAPPQARAN